MNYIALLLQMFAGNEVKVKYDTHIKSKNVIANDVYRETINCRDNKGVLNVLCRAFKDGCIKRIVDMCAIRIKVVFDILGMVSAL